MRPPLLVALLAALVAAGGAAGCIRGAFFPAEIPGTALVAGWSADAANSEGGERGLPPLVAAQYQVNAYRGGLVDRVYVISVSDVPLVDEQAEIQQQIDAQIAEAGVGLTLRNSGTGTVAGATVPYTVYDATFRGASGLAIDVPFTCPANGMAVRVFGFTSTTAGGLLGNPRAAWEALAGQADRGTLGGMVTQVRCSP